MHPCCFSLVIKVSCDIPVVISDTSISEVIVLLCLFERCSMHGRYICPLNSYLMAILK